MLSVVRMCHRHTTFLFLSLAMITSACDVQIGRKSEQGVWTPPPTTESVLFGYALEDQNCLGQNGVDSVTQGEFFGLQESNVIPVQQSLYGISSSPSLHGQFVRSTGYGMETKTACAQDQDRQSCETTSEIIQNPAPLKICRTNASYNRESLEGISITSIVAIERFFRFYHSLPNQNSALEAVDLLVMPKFVSKFPTYETPKMDNLSYYPSLTDYPTIVVFPKGAFGRSMWPNINLWEAPWIISHEGAHHIFRTQYADAHPEANAEVLEAIDHPAPILNDLGESHHHSERESGDDAAGSLTTRDILGSVNEGFADLMAFYSMGEKPKIEKLTCFAKSRDVSSAVFADDQPKILSRKALNRFQGIEQNALGNICESTDYRDIHNIGAIIVYGINRLFSEVPSVQKAESPAWAKASLAINWIQNMPTNIEASEAGLMSLVTAGLKTAADSQGVLSASQCEVVQQIFPTIWESAAQQFGCSH